MYLGDSPY
ncbi:hypothetical protein LINPERHAP2_LOCUS11671 [Linum perenne]